MNWPYKEEEDAGSVIASRSEDFHKVEDSCRRVTLKVACTAEYNSGNNDADSWCTALVADEVPDGAAPRLERTGRDTGHPEPPGAASQRTQEAVSPARAKQPRPGASGSGSAGPGCRPPSGGSAERRAGGQPSSAISSISTQAPIGNCATPNALRACAPITGPKTWPSSSLQPLVTRCCSV